MIFLHASKILSYEGNNLENYVITNNTIILTRACVFSHFSRVLLFGMPWTVTRQAPLSMGFSKARILE